MGNMQTIGATLRTARVNQGLTLVELAAQCGVSTSHISQLELGTRRPSLPMVVRLAEALGLQPSELLAPLDY